MVLFFCLFFFLSFQVYRGKWEGHSLWCYDAPPPPLLLCMHHVSTLLIKQLGFILLLFLGVFVESMRGSSRE
jgi:hypothetical protein